MCTDGIWAFQRDARNRLEEEELGRNQNAEEEEHHGHGLPSLASSQLESLKHFGSCLQVTLASAYTVGRSSPHWPPEGAFQGGLQWHPRPPLSQPLRMEKETLQVSGAAPPGSGLEARSLRDGDGQSCCPSALCDASCPVSAQPKAAKALRRCAAPEVWQPREQTGGRYEHGWERPQSARLRSQGDL